MQISKVVLLAAALTGAASPGQAFLLLLGAGAEPEPVPPPTLRELPALNADQAVRPSGLPAPHSLAPQTRAMPPLGEQHAQVSNEELLRRLERLERENEQLRRQQGPPGAAATTTPRGGLPSSPLPAQVTSGWWVHLHTYNTAGDLGPGPVRTFRYDQQEFNTTIGFRETNPSAWSEINLYRFEAWLRVTSPGSYQIGAVLNCAFEHPCAYRVMLDGIGIAEFQGQHGGTTNQLVFGARHLEPGDYRMEMVFFIPKTNFMKYRPHAVSMRPQIRTAADMNFRDFSSTELLIPDRRDVPLGPAMQRPTSW